MTEDVCEREYNLTCKVKIRKIWVEDNQNEKGIVRSERTMVYLIPQESDQRTRFLTAWLPEVAHEYYEVASFIASPIDSPCRLSVHRGPDSRNETHYLFVMSTGVSEILSRLKEDSLVNVKILPASKDSETDFAKDSSEGNYELA